MTQLLVSRPSTAPLAGPARPQPPLCAASWLDEHALALDSDGEPVTSAFLADEVTAYCIKGCALHASSSDTTVRDIARQLTWRHFFTPGHSRSNDDATPLYQALLMLREELRQQPY